ncbi:hypothetical protein AB0A95_17675 [Micromonospora sp. NPDC049230]|uniref:hypothetical protein n=1 Tax=Micromonospora sp. NPDC049230 TaxID=3155502 RepID=UPI0033D4CF7F
MDGRVWILVGVAALLLTVLLVAALLVVRRRRRRAPAGADETMRRARQAIQASGHRQHRHRRGTTRGKGYGGNDSQAHNSGIASDSGGGP